MSSVLHRYPTILPDRQPWREEYEQMKDEMSMRHREVGRRY